MDAFARFWIPQLMGFAFRTTTISHPVSTTHMYDAVAAGHDIRQSSANADEEMHIRNCPSPMTIVRN